jgi:hypothetical protein
MQKAREPLAARRASYDESRNSKLENGNSKLEIRNSAKHGNSKMEIRNSAPNTETRIPTAGEGVSPHAAFHLPPTGLAMKAYVLDASALMTFFEDRPGADKVEELLAKAAEAKRPLAMSVVN